MNPQDRPRHPWPLFAALRHGRRTVRGKLVRVVLLTTLIVLLIAGSAIIVHDLSVYRASWAGDVAAEADVLALAAEPAIAFDDRELAARDLAALRARRNIIAAALYTPDGRLYAAYERPGEEVPQTLPLAPGVRVLGERVEIARAVTHNDEALGTLYLRAHYEVSDRISAYLGIFALITVASILTALVLSASLQEEISQPLEEIAGVARGIVERRDYALRVGTITDDEIGLVTRALNGMLDEVQLRTLALERSNASLQEQIGVRRIAEAALSLANARLESAMAAAEIGGWTSDLVTGHIAADRNFAALYGLPDESAFAADPGLRRRGIHREDRGAVDAAELAALKTGILSTADFRIVQPQGGVRWVIARGKVQYGDDGAPRLLAGLLIDVTARKRAEEQRQESEIMFRAIGESIDFGVWTADAEGNATYASESFLRLAGMSLEQYRGNGWANALHPEETEPALAAWRDCVRHGQFWYREVRVRGADAAWHPVLCQGVPIRRADGSIAGWAGLNLDISRIKRTEEALREADRRKDEFLATLAHELRNPLAPIGNASRLLGAEGVSDAQRQWAREVIARQVRHMALLLDDLLDVSRITRGRLELRKDRVALGQLVGAAVETARPLIDARNHTLRISLPQQPLELNVDPLRMAQVLSNLLTNAAKYTEPGGLIELEGRLEREDLAIVVRDNGVGLSQSALPHVFEMFFQVGSALGGSQGGLGIGLALARGLLTLHGGSIEAVSSGPGRGSTFTVRLPRHLLLEPPPPDQPGEGEAGAAGGAGQGRLLVADDNHDAADSLATLLRLLGYEVLVAYDGATALELALAQRPGILILDIGMPQLNGYEVARRLREEAWGRAAKLIALTGWGQQEDLDRARAAGFDHHFRKPVDVNALLGVLAGKE